MPDNAGYIWEFTSFIDITIDGLSSSNGDSVNSYSRSDHYCKYHVEIIPCSNWWLYNFQVLCWRWRIWCT